MVDFSVLTPAQLRVVRTAVERRDFSAKTLAQVLGVSPHTVTTHKTKIYERLGLHTELTVVLAYLEWKRTKLGGDLGF